MTINKKNSERLKQIAKVMNCDCDTALTHILRDRNLTIRLYKEMAKGYNKSHCHDLVLELET